MKKRIELFKKNYKTNKKFALCFNILMFAFVCFLSVGFASISLNIKMGDISAVVRVEDDVRVTGVHTSKVTGEGISNWEEYNVANISSGFNLPHPDSTITYTVETIVFGKNEYGILGIEGLPDNLEYVMSGYSFEKKICDNNVTIKCSLGAKKTFDITVKYKDGGYNASTTSYAMTLKFDFRRIFEVKYENISSAGLVKETIEGKSLEISFKENYGIDVFMDNKKLTAGSEYTYSAGKFTIPNVTGDLIIRRQAHTLAETILANNTISDGCPTQLGDTKYFQFTGNEANTKFCKALDDYGDTYYYRGDTKNNYVSFAGIKWRIIRVNGDGSVRLTTEDPIGMSEYLAKSSDLDNTHVGYMNNNLYSSSYTQAHNNTKSSTNSTLKATIDKWYEDRILNKYDDYVSDTYFCNDRAIYNTDYGELNLFQDHLIEMNSISVNFGKDTGLGYGYNTTFYGASYRITYDSVSTLSHQVQNITYSCYNKNDRFTVNDTTIGNGALKYPVATVTIDDVIFAGSKYGDYDANYDVSNAIHTDTRYWTMTPGGYGNTNRIYIGSYYPNGYVTFETEGSITSGVRPVINIKPDIFVSSGKGTELEPYVITNRDISISGIEDQLQQMTLDEKIGQMIIVSASGKGQTLSNTFKTELEAIKPGGVILFGDNISNSTTLKTYINNIKATADIPMFISVDQEGGRVQRLKSITDVAVTDIPPMYDVGLTDSENVAYDVGRVIGEELGVFGFNMDFAPVADVWSNPNNPVINNRSFGNDADLVAKMSVSTANGILSTGIIPVYKHFPGHGDTATDSHSELPVINKSKEELERTEIVPFRNAIDKGAKVIMIGHLDVPALTGTTGVPTSMSYKLIKDYLKGELGYDGVVITDGLNMKGVTNYLNANNLSLGVEGVNAGVDIFLGPEDPVALFNQIKDGVLSGKINEKDIDRSVTKILKLKEEMSPVVYDNSYLNNTDHKNVIESVYPNLTDNYPDFGIDYKGSASEYVKSLASVTGGNVNNETGYRYVSKDAKNYVAFNGERWRIIGAFDNSVHGQTGDLVKIIRNDSIGRYAWDSGGSSNWANSSSKKLLNDTYYNTLYSNSKNMIQQSKWYLGAHTSMWRTINTFLTQERSGETVNANIGLVYMSDYLLAAPASTCSRTGVNANQNAYDNKSNNCATNNWMNFSHNQDTFASIMAANIAAGPMTVQVTNGDYAQFTGVNQEFAIYPTLYLKANVKITKGDGTYQYPYVLEYTG